jgi:hypothetical protein
MLIAGVALAIAAAALVRARRLARRLEQLSESYWELRYDYGQLRARIARLEPAEHSEPTPPAVSTTFVPLSSIKR